MTVKGADRWTGKEMVVQVCALLLSLLLLLPVGGGHGASFAPKNFDQLVGAIVTDVTVTNLRVLKKAVGRPTSLGRSA